MSLNIDYHSPLVHNEPCLKRSGRIGHVARTLSFFRISAASGCPGCTLTANAIEKWCRAFIPESKLKILSKVPDEAWDENDIQAKVRHGKGPGAPSGVPSMSVEFWEGEYRMTGLGGTLQIFREPGDWVEATYKPEFGKFHNMMGRSDDVERKYIEWVEYEGGKPGLDQLVGARRLRERQSDSDACFDIVKGWMKSCSEKHPGCASPDPGYLPLRVLDVSSESTVKLVENPERKGPYIALSHCWGKMVPITTTLQSIDERKRGIPVSELPTTFQDAAVLCRRLAIDYLWIDSLCIIQDSPKDWATESSKMYKVYSNAALVVAATRAPDSTFGLFHTRKPSEKAIKGFHSIPSTSKSGSEPVELTVRLSEVSTSHKNFKSSHQRPEGHPLLTRAWCLQERMLATRVLHFCEEELVWECHTCMLCECMGLDASTDNSSSSTENWYFKQRWTIRLGGGVASLEANLPESIVEKIKNKKNLYEAWHTIVSTASKMQITAESDRMPALSGMAKRMIEQGAGTYAAGLWEEHMKRDLLWAATDIAASRLDLRPPGRSSEWRAPSWSWASMESAEISFPDYERAYDDKDYEVKISKVECKPSSDDPTGNVETGMITIEGLVTECLLGHEYKEHLQKHQGRRLHLNVPGQEKQLVCPMICDTPLSSEKDNGPVGRKVFLLLMRRDNRDPNSNDPTPFHALVLRESRGLGGREKTPGAHERIGIVQRERVTYLAGMPVKWQQWFANAERRTMLLV